MIEPAPRALAPEELLEAVDRLGGRASLEQLERDLDQQRGGIHARLVLLERAGLVYRETTWVLTSDRKGAEADETPAASRPTPRVHPRELRGRARLVYQHLRVLADWTRTDDLRARLKMSGGAVRPVLEQLVRQGLVERGERAKTGSVGNSVRTWRAVPWRPSP